MSPIEQIRYDIQARLEAHDGTVDMSDYYSAQLAALDDIERRLQTAERVAGRQVVEASKWFKMCESLESDAAALRKALEPFAKLAEEYNGLDDSDGIEASYSDHWPDFLVSDLRRAARALKGQP